MMFKDSHNEWQPIIGYGWEKGWYLDSSRDFRLGLGVTAGITAPKTSPTTYRYRLFCRSFPPAIAA
jgi:hypothetical protein